MCPYSLFPILRSWTLHEFSIFFWSRCHLQSRWHLPPRCLPSRRQLGHPLVRTPSSHQLGVKQKMIGNTWGRKHQIIINVLFCYWWFVTPPFWPFFVIEEVRTIVHLMKNPMIGLQQLINLVGCGLRLRLANKQDQLTCVALSADHHRI